MNITLDFNSKATVPHSDLIIANSNNQDELNFTILNLNKDLSDNKYIVTLVSQFGNIYAESKVADTTTNDTANFKLPAYLIPFAGTYDMFVRVLDSITGDIDSSGVINIKVEKGVFNASLLSGATTHLSYAELIALIQQESGSSYTRLTYTNPQPSQFVFDTPIDLENGKLLDLVIETDTQMPNDIRRVKSHSFKIIDQQMVANDKSETYDGGVDFEFDAKITNNKLLGFNIYLVSDGSKYPSGSYDLSMSDVTKMIYRKVVIN